MDCRQVALVQDTFARATKIAPHLAATFYAELFAIDPTLRPMFKRDIIVQGEKLVAMLSDIVDGLSAPDAILPHLRSLAVRHVAYGVEKKHYALVGVALMRTLRHELGAGLTPEARAAWESAYRWVSDAMCKAAYEAP